MSSIERSIERFCYKHPKFGIMRLMLYITIGTALVYVVERMDTTGTFTYFLTFDPAYILRGQVWRLVTWVFLSDGSNLIFEAIILYFYYFIGSALENQWGQAKFTLYYVLGMVLQIVFGFILWAICGTYMFRVYSGLFTSYYLNLSMFFAFAALYPDHRVLVYFIIPIKMKWLAIIDALFFIYNIIVMPFPMSLLPLVAVLNFVLFCGGSLLRYVRRNTATAPNTVNFRREAAKIKREQASQPYRHKCAVCGRTDADHPELEFRYCSRCQGYHCFCIDHINSHVHFTS